MSGSPLADRLVQAGASAILVAYGPATERKARLALAAGLRELAVDYQERDQLVAHELRGLAVSVEKGENT